MERALVFKVAEEIIAEGKKPTSRAILARLGGSLRDIVPILREWRETRTRYVSRKVQRALKAYQSLDAMEKETFQALACLKPMSLAQKISRLGRLTKAQGITPELIEVLEPETKNVIDLKERPI